MECENQALNDAPVLHDKNLMRININVFSWNKAVFFFAAKYLAIF